MKSACVKEGFKQMQQTSSKTTQTYWTTFMGPNLITGPQVLHQTAAGVSSLLEQDDRENTKVVEQITLALICVSLLPLTTYHTNPSE